MPLLFLALAAAALADDAVLANIKSVYVLPMNNGLDQYLANRLQEGQVVAITTDPQEADAILTDSIGPAFEKRVDVLYPPPVPEPPKKEKEEEEAEQGSASKGIIGKEDPVVRVSSFRKGRGVVFLVDRRTRKVVWSAHSRPKNTTPKELDRTAQRMSDWLKKAYAGKVKE